MPARLTPVGRGYVVYEEFETRPGIQMLNCMAHARRKFVDAQQNDGERAQHALRLFQKLYEVERAIKEKGLSGEALLQLRQKDAVPVLIELEGWMIKQYPQVTPGSVIGKAISYCLPRWKKLSLYTTDAILLIDNNPVENAIRPVAIGRKNYLFAGSHVRRTPLEMQPSVQLWYIHCWLPAASTK